MRNVINKLINDLELHKAELEKFESYTEFDRGLFKGNIDLLELIINKLEVILPRDFDLIKMEKKLIFQDLGIRKTIGNYKCRNGWVIDADLYPQIDVKNSIIWLRGKSKDADNLVTVISCESNLERDELYDEIIKAMFEYNFQCDWEEYINK